MLLEELPEDPIGVEVLRAFSQDGEDGLFAWPCVATTNDFVELDLAMGIEGAVAMANDVGSIGVCWSKGLYRGGRFALIDLCPGRKGFDKGWELGFGKALLTDSSFHRREIIVRAMNVADGDRATGSFHGAEHGASDGADSADAICNGAGQRVGHHRSVGKACDKDLAWIDRERVLEMIKERLQVAEIVNLLLGGMAVKATNIPTERGTRSACAIGIDDGKTFLRGEFG